MKKGKNLLVITDQGTGGRFCSICSKELNGRVRKCPFCGAILEINTDYSDFGNYDVTRY